MKIFKDRHFGNDDFANILMRTDHRNQKKII
jgi:hypothetical protein